MNLLKVIDDRELLLRLQNGDVIAFDIIYTHYADIIALRLHKLIKLPDIVEEIHQDVFIRLWNHRNNIEPNTVLRAYLCTIARNLAIDFYRKAARDKELESQLLDYVTLSYNPIDTLLNYKETKEIIESVISKLPPRRQQVFRMIKMEGKSYIEASQYFGVSMSTIKDHMEKSVEFLKHQLKQNYPHIIFTLSAYFILV